MRGWVAISARSAPGGEKSLCGNDEVLLDAFFHLRMRIRVLKVIGA